MTDENDKPKTGIVELSDEEIAAITGEGNSVDTTGNEPDFDQGSVAEEDALNAQEDEDSQGEVDGDDADDESAEDSDKARFTVRSQEKMLKRINRLTAQLKTAQEEIEQYRASQEEATARAKAAEDARFASLQVLPEYLSQEDRRALDTYAGELERYDHSIDFWQKGAESGEGAELGGREYTAEECNKHVVQLSRMLGSLQAKRDAILERARSEMVRDLREFRAKQSKSGTSVGKPKVIAPAARQTRVVTPAIVGSTSVRESSSDTRPTKAPTNQDEARRWFSL
jgi:hypothetical protein